MRHFRLLVAVGGVGAVTIVGLLAVKGWRHAIAAAGIALIAGAVGAEFLGSVRDVVGDRVTAFDRLLVRTRAAPGRPVDLASLERTLGWGTYSQEEFRHRVRPTLYRLARLRLLERSGLDIATEPGRAPEMTRRYLLDDDLSGSVSTEDIAAVVDELEGI